MVLTHPDIAALVTPLPALRKEEVLNFLPSLRRSRREGGPAKRRPGESTIRHDTSGMRSKMRHCEERSNPKLYRAALLIGDCFVPRNDVFYIMISNIIPKDTAIALIYAPSLYQPAQIIDQMQRLTYKW